MARSGRPERTIRQQCQRWSNMGRAHKRDGEWRIDPTVDPALLAPVEAVAGGADVLDIRQVSAAKRSAAFKRQRILAEAEVFVSARVHAGTMDRVAALKLFAAQYPADKARATFGLKFSWRSIYRWQQRKKAAPATGLVDRRGLTGDGPREPDPDVMAVIQARLLTTNQLSYHEVYDEVVYYCDRHQRWCWGSYHSFRRWVHRTYPEAMMTLNRQGEHAYIQKHEPALPQDPDTWTAGEVYVGDHHEFRAFVRYQGRIIRPWITAWIDQRSLMYVGWIISPMPNRAHICAALAKAFREFGLSQEAWMDNGHDFSSYAMTGLNSRRASGAKSPWVNYDNVEHEHLAGLMGLVGTQARFVLPGHPNSKVIEGMFRPIEERFVRALPNYCGANPDDRPADMDRRLARTDMIPEFERFAEDADTWIRRVYNQKPQEGIYCAGLSPAQVFAAKRGPAPVLADPRVLDLFDLVWNRPVKVNKRGIRCNGIYYGTFNPEVVARQGQYVRVTYDPSDIRSIGVWDLHHRFLFRADQQLLINRKDPVSDEHSREGNRIKARLKNAMKVNTELGHLRYEDSAGLALAAQSMAAKRQLLDAEPAAGPAAPPTVRLVQTPLDGQTNAVQRAFDRPSPEAWLPSAGDLLGRMHAAAESPEPTADLPALPVLADLPVLGEILDSPRCDADLDAGLCENSIMERLRAEHGQQ